MAGNGLRRSAVELRMHEVGVSGPSHRAAAISQRHQNQSLQNANQVERIFDASSAHLPFLAPAIEFHSADSPDTPRQLWLNYSTRRRPVYGI